MIRSKRSEGVRRAVEGASAPLMNLEFDAPIITVSEANRREHWTARSLRRRLQRTAMTVFLKNALQGRSIQLPCLVKLTRIGPKAMDSDNLAGSQKGLRDAIAQVLGVDDGDPRIKFDYAQEAIGRREYNVRVSITSV